MFYKCNTKYLFVSIFNNWPKAHYYPISIWTRAEKEISYWKPSFLLYSTMKTSESQEEISKENEQSSERKEGKQGKHVQITSNSYRDCTVSQAVVTEVYQVSPSVKAFTLNVLDSNLTFLSGQWVDVFIPDVDFIGGFSICSSPLLLKEKSQIILGIKKALWPPAYWFYEKCRSGSQISIRVGGDFYFPHESEEHKDLLLIAGGVGVNPIFSIYSHYCDMKAQSKSHTGKVSFMFSAKTEEELLYKPLIDSFAKKYPGDIFTHYFVTKDDRCHGDDKGIIRNKRMTIDDISTGLNGLNKLHTKVYICGPPSMIENIAKSVVRCDLPESNIYYEKWW